MRKKSLLVIFLSVFLDLFGFGVVLPLLPRYAERFGATGIWIGAIIASFSVMQFFFTPWWGRLSDHIGRRPVILISNAGASISYILFAVASLLEGSQALWLLLVSRVFAGICGGNLSVASAYIADITPPEKRSQGMGLIGVAFGLGFILGPALGSLGVSLFGLSGPGWIAAALCAGNFAYGFLVLAESRTATTASAPPQPKFTQWKSTLRRPGMGFLVGIYFLSTFCFAAFESTLPLLLGSPAFHPDDFLDPPGLVRKLRTSTDPLAQRVRETASPTFRQVLDDPDAGTLALRTALFNGLNEVIRGPLLVSSNLVGTLELSPKLRTQITGEFTPEDRTRLNRQLLTEVYTSEIKQGQVIYDERSMGYLFAYCGIVSALIQGGIIGRLVRRFGEERLIFGSLLLLAGSLALIPYAVGLAWLLLALGLFAAGSGTNRAPTMGLISIYSPANEQGANLGVAQSAGTLARIVGPLFGTALYKYSPHSPYLLCALIALAAGLIAKRALSPSHRPEG